MGFIRKLAERRRIVKSCLCIGIDPDTEDIEHFTKQEKENECMNIKNNLKEDAINYIEEEKDIILKDDISNIGTKHLFFFLNHFCFYIINVTKEYALAYKMNFGFFIFFGTEGIDALKNIFVYLKHINIPTILDIKLNDIGNTVKTYRHYIFDYLESDCCTVNVYMGTSLLKDICYDQLKKRYYSVYVLIKTTNSDSDLFQNKLLINDKKAYFVMAEESDKIAQELKIEKNDEFIGFVVGANKYEEMNIIRNNFPNCFILAPGVGAQDADLQKAIVCGFHPQYEKILINVGRAISKSKNPHEAAQSFHRKINNIITSLYIK